MAEMLDPHSPHNKEVSDAPTAPPFLFDGSQHFLLAVVLSVVEFQVISASLLPGRAAIYRLKS